MFVNPVLKMIAIVGIMSLIALPVYFLDVREFKFQKSSTVAMISSSDIISEFEVTFSVGSALIHCADSCAQSTFCAGVELCETTPKVCRLWGTEFSVQWVNQSVPQCRRFQKILQTTFDCPDCDCVSAYEAWSGVKTLTVNGQPMQVQCYNNGDFWWTVIQRRIDGSVLFERNWNSYKSGFGSLTSEFWLGNDNIHLLTTSGLTFLRIELLDYSGIWKYAEYRTFTVDSEVNKYKLVVSGYTGDAGDSMAYHNGLVFSTYDSDNDQWGDNCASLRKGGWWYKYCHEANLNGEYANVNRSDGINWLSWHGFEYSMKEVRMLIRKP